VYTSKDLIIEGFEKIDNTYYLKDDIGSIEILEINEKIKSIYLNFDSDKEIQLKLLYTDDNSSTYTVNKNSANQDVAIYSKYERSKYIPCDYIGMTEKIKLVFDKNDYKQYSSFMNDYVGSIECSFNSIEINKAIPFNFKFPRLILLFIVISIIYALIKEDFFNQYYCNSEKQKTAILLVVLFFISIQVIITGGVIYRNTVDIYCKDYTDALINGQLSLLDKPSQELLNLSDPYDYGLRLDKDCKWDTVLYNGKYYVYFGILPALLFFVPIKLLGFELSTSVLAVILAVFSTIITTKFFITLIKKFFKNIPFKYVIILLLFFLFNSRILWIIARPQLYEMIIISAYFFVMLGMYMIIKSDLLTDFKNVKWTYLFFGCLFLALAVACRPTALLISILILPDLIRLAMFSIKEIKHDKKLITNFILFVFFPYMVIGVLLALLNYIRFNNILEFGDSYQITVTNIKNMQFSFTRLLLGLRKFLFDVPIMREQFPFIFSNTYRPSYQGIFYLEATGGGIFSVSILTFIIFIFPFLQRDMKKSSYIIRKFIFYMLIVAALMLFTFLYKYGVSGRYIIDVAWLFNLSAVLIILFIYSQIKDNEAAKKVFLLTIIFIVLLSCFYNMFGAITGTSNLLKNTNLSRWYILKDMFTFLQ
jgi:hypothetical protein